MEAPVQEGVYECSGSPVVHRKLQYFLEVRRRVGGELVDKAIPLESGVLYQCHREQLDGTALANYCVDNTFLAAGFLTGSWIDEDGDHHR